MNVIEFSISNYVVCFLFNEPAATEIYTDRHTLSLHDALPISRIGQRRGGAGQQRGCRQGRHRQHAEQGKYGHASPPARGRSEEHTSELQSLMRISYAVFCLKKKKTYDYLTDYTPYAKPHTSPQQHYTYAHDSQKQLTVT